MNVHRASSATSIRLRVILVISLLVAACTSGPEEDGSKTVPEETTTTQADSPVTSEVPDEETAEAELPETWAGTNPGGGGAFAEAAIGPEGLLVAASDLSGAYISVDDGENWRSVGSRNGLTTTHVSSIALHPANPNQVLLGTEEGVFASLDQGETFQSVIDEGYATAIGVAATGTVSYAAISQAFDSSDATIWRARGDAAGSVVGEFTPLDSNFPGGLVVLGLRIDPDNPERVIALTGQGRFATGPAEAWLSEDGGEAWRQLGAGLGAVTDIRLVPGTPGRVVLTTTGEEDGQVRSNGLYVSDDGGQAWQQRHKIGGVLWLDDLRPDILRFVDVERQFPEEEWEGIWQSRDVGETWARIGSVENWNPGWSSAPWVFGPPFDGLSKTLAFDANNPHRALWINGQFVYETLNDGATFRPLFTNQIADENPAVSEDSEPDEEEPSNSWLSRGFDNVVIADVAAGQADPNLWIVGYWDLGCFRSLNAGASWENCNDQNLSGTWQGAGGFMGTVLVDPMRPRTVWAALGDNWETPATMVRSSDGGSGDSWEQAGEDVIGIDAMGLSLDPTSPDDERVLFVTVDGDVQRSTDDGRSWELVFDCDGCRTTTVLSDGIVLAGGEAGLWWSEAAGESGSWLQVSTEVMSGSVVGPPWTFGWSGVTAITPGTNQDEIFASVFEPAWPNESSEDDSTVEGGVYRSVDGGRTWEIVRPALFARTVAVDPSTGWLWFGTSSAFEAGGFNSESSGLSVSKDDGETWDAVDAGLAYPLVSNLEFAEDTILIGSPGMGLVAGR